jgi:hypothetical protein
VAHLSEQLTNSAQQSFNIDLLPCREERRVGSTKDIDFVILRDYQDFLTLWKDADPDIPILQQAKAEYAKLQ